MSTVDYLSTEDLLDIAAGVLGEVLVRDLGLIESAAARPRSTVFGDDAYPTIPLKAAALMQSLARNDALIDGNKRLAWAATRVFLILNDLDLRADVDEAEVFVHAVVAGELDATEMAAWLKNRLV